MHYFGEAFVPEHMRDIANLAADALAGHELPDWESRMHEAKVHAREMAEALSIELLADP